MATLLNQPSSVNGMSRRAGGPLLASALVLTSIVLLWLFGWVPNLVSMLTVGRGYISGLETTVERSALANTVSVVALYGAVACLVLALLLEIPKLARLVLFPVALIMGAWAVLYPLQGDVSVSAAVFPLLFVTWMVVRPGKAGLYRLLAWIGVTTAALSIAFAFISPLAFMPAQWTLDADKALLGNNILAGPYSHSNALGLTLALTLPFAALYFRRQAKFAAIVIICIALLWSASRLSTLTAICTITFSLVALYVRPARARALLSSAVVVTAAVIVALPLLTKDPTFATNRGFIWITSLGFARNAPLTGYGADVFRDVNALTTRMGFVSTTGHNVFVTLFTTGGLIVLTLVLVFGIVAFVTSRREFSVDRIPLLFIAVLLVSSVAEDPIRAFWMGPFAFVIYPMMAVMVSGREASPGDSVSGTISELKGAAPTRA